MDREGFEQGITKGQKRAPVFIISGGGWPGAYDIVRALGRKGVPSVVASSQIDEIAFPSRYVQGKLVLPPFQPSHYNKIFEILLQSGSQFVDRPLLFYVGDSELEFVSHFKDRLGSTFRFLLPTDDVLRSVCNKGLFPDFATQYGLPIPITKKYTNIDDLVSSIDSLDFPCIVKPILNRNWFGDHDAERRSVGSYKEALRRFGSKEDLMKFSAMLPYRSSELVVQAYIDGAEESVVSFNGYFDEESRCLGYITGREIRTNPPINGESAYSEIFVDKDLAQLSIEYLQRMKFRGIVKIDYKWDANEKIFKMIEIEPHYQFWHLLGSYAGINLVFTAYCHQIGEPVEPSRSIKNGERMLYFKHDIKAYLRYYRKTERWRLHVYLRSLFRKQHFRVFDLKDPLPFFWSLTSYVTKKLF